MLYDFYTQCIHIVFKGCVVSLCINGIRYIIIRDEAKEMSNICLKSEVGIK